MKFDGKSYPAERKYLAWSLNSAGSLLRDAAFLIASITDSKDRHLWMCSQQSSKALFLQCTLEKKCHFTQYYKDHNGEEKLAPYFQWGKQNKVSFNSCRYVIHHYRLRFELLLKICSNSSRNVKLVQELLVTYWGGHTAAGQSGRW